MGPAPHPTQGIPFWQLLTIHVFRLGVYLATRLARPTLDQLQDLPLIASYRELHALGYTQRDMSVVLHRSHSTIQGYARRSREAPSSVDNDGPLNRLVTALRARSLTSEEIRRLLPDSDEVPYARLALRLLTRQGQVQRRRASHKDTWAWIGGAPPASSRAMGQVEATWTLALTALHLLAHEPMRPKQLRSHPALSDHGAEAVQGALDALQEEALVEPDADGFLAPRAAVVKLIPRQWAERQRVGILSFVDALRRPLLTASLRETPEPPVGQRLFRFRATPQDLKALIQAHHDHTREAILAADAASSEGDPTVTLTWLIAPDPVSGGAREPDAPG